MEKAKKENGQLCLQTELIINPDFFLEHQFCICFCNFKNVCQLCSVQSTLIRVSRDVKGPLMSVNSNQLLQINGANVSKVDFYRRAKNNLRLQFLLFSPAFTQNVFK